MIPAATLLVGIILGALGTWFLQRDDRTYLRNELRVAHAQIAHAVLQEGAQVPMRIEEPEPIEPLDSEYQACIEQWEGVEHRRTEEGKIRNWIGQGWGKQAILKQYGLANGEGV